MHLFLGIVLLNSVFTVKAARWECDNFPSGRDPLSGCSWGYSHISWGSGNIEGVPDPAGDSGNALRVFFPEGSINPGSSPPKPEGGVGFTANVFGGEEFDHLTLEYDIYYDNTFQWVRGGKLPGLISGYGSCSGGGNDETCASFRYMWRGAGDHEIYGYIPVEKNPWYCNDPHIICNFDFGHSFGRGAPGYRLETGKWYTLKQYIKLNAPGRGDSRIEAYLDNDLVFDIEGAPDTDPDDESYRGIQIRLDSTHKLNHIYFQMFFGGSSDDWACAADTYIYLRNFKVYD